MVHTFLYNNVVKSGQTAERKGNSMKNKVIGAAISLGGAAVIWIGGWGFLSVMSQLFSALNL